MDGAEAWDLGSKLGFSPCYLAGTLSKVSYLPGSFLISKRGPFERLLTQTLPHLCSVHWRKCHRLLFTHVLENTTQRETKQPLLNFRVIPRTRSGDVRMF